MIYQSVMASKPYIPPIIEEPEPSIEDTTDVNNDSDSEINLEETETKIENEPEVDTGFYVE